MSNYLKTISLLLLINYSQTSCDSDGETYYYFTNNTQQDIQLVMYYKYYSSKSDTFLVKQDETCNFMSKYSRNGDAEMIQLERYDSAIVFNTQFDSIYVKWIQPEKFPYFLTGTDARRMEIKDYYFENDWVIKKKSKHLFKEYFSISQSDIDNYKE